MNSRNGEVYGQVLFYIDKEAYDNNKLLNSSASRTDDLVFLNSRESYRRLEGILTNETDHSRSFRRRRVSQQR
ncbi:MAG: hypothetical protein V8Q40_09940 [Anaerosacchariphilus sp.]